MASGQGKILSRGIRGRVKELKMTAANPLWSDNKAALENSFNNASLDNNKAALEKSLKDALLSRNNAPSENSSNNASWGNNKNIENFSNNASWNNKEGTEIPSNKTLLGNNKNIENFSNNTSWGNNKNIENSSWGKNKAVSKNSYNNATWGNNKAASENLSNNASWGNNKNIENSSKNASWNNKESGTEIASNKTLLSNNKSAFKHSSNTSWGNKSSWGNNNNLPFATEPGTKKETKHENVSKEKFSSTWSNNKDKASENFSKPNNSWGKKIDSKENDKNINADNILSHSSFIPEKRTIEDLYKEDAENAEFYRIVTDDDEDIAISGLGLAEEHILAIDKWEDAGFEEIILNNIQKSQYVRPRKIQSYTVPLILEDIQGHAETGSGKTAAFMLPIINEIMKHKHFDAPDVELGRPSPFAIIVEPTRELCGQIAEQGRKFADGTRVMVTKTYGQYDLGASRKEIMMGCHILCATPGRLKHVLNSKWVSLDKLKFFVLDEADRLLEDNFIDIIRECLNTPNFPKKEDRQNLLFSATFPEEIQKLSMDVLRKNNVMISKKILTNQGTNNSNQINHIAVNNKIMQSFISVEAQEKKKALLDILKKDADSSKDETICRTLVFVKTRREADLLALWLTSEGIKATNINGDRTQFQRERALRDFRSRNTFVLVSTDVCARGIDIKDLDHVVNYDLPDDKVTYVHRIGRTGRIKNGFATSFFDENSEKDRLLAKDLHKFVIDAGQESPEFLKKIVYGSGQFDVNNPWVELPNAEQIPPHVDVPSQIWDNNWT